MNNIHALNIRDAFYLVPDEVVVSRRLIDLANQDRKELAQTIHKLRQNKLMIAAGLPTMQLHIYNLAQTYGRNIVIDMAESVLSCKLSGATHVG